MREDNLSLLNTLGIKYKFTQLSQAFAGVVGQPRFSLSNEISQPSLVVSSSSVADISTLFSDLRSCNGGRYLDINLVGGCADEDKSIAVVMKSIAEAAERYAMTVISPDEYILASANELGNEALDWSLFPRCEEKEYQSLNSPITAFNPNLKIRWVKGLSLITGEQKYVPLALTHITTKSRRAEEFCLPISTGVAVHTDIDEVIARAIMEVVERDSISLTWLLQPELPRIAFDIPIPKEFESRFNAFKKSHVSQYLFDATTDLGIPVVYSVMHCKGHPRVVNVVTAACDIDPFSACAKAMREAVSTRLAVISYPEQPESVEQCISLEHGAVFMGLPEQQKAFDFLINSSKQKKKYQT